MKVIVIVGPTASGKTALSLKLAKKYNAEIISADSRQVYRGMDIGTAKAPISSAIRRGRRVETKSSVISSGIPHHLVDIKYPNQDYSLGQFKKDALKAMRDITNRGKIPMLVGGTGLYISAMVNNLDIPAIKPNKHLRKKLEKMIRRHGTYYGFGKLTALDPEAAYIVDPRNSRRIIRALEIALISKKPFSTARKKGPPLFDFLILGLDMPPEKLKNRIGKRVETMVRAGLVKEVKKLIKKYGKRRVPFDAIGYREIIDYLDKKITLREAIEQIKRNTWRFARRQMTWFRRLPVTWIKKQKHAEKAIAKFLS